MNDYQSIPELTKEQAEQLLNKVEGDDLCLVLLALSTLTDWRWVQSVYLQYIDHVDKWVASSAISGLGDLARCSRMIDRDIVLRSSGEVDEIVSLN